MAISIIEDESLYENAYNPIVWTVDSTNKAQCDFRYICDVYVNGTYRTRLKLFPLGTNGYASFKVNRVIEDYLSYDLQTNLMGFAANPTSIVSYQLKFGEEYSSACDGNTTIYPNLTTGTLSYAFNGTLQYREYNSWDYQDFEPGSATKRFLTDRPDTILIMQGDEFVLNFLQDGTGTPTTSPVHRARIRTYDSSGSIIQTIYISNTLSVLSAVGRRMLSVGCGPQNLNNTSYTTGVTQPVINQSVYSYDVTLVNSGASAISETLTFEIDRRSIYYEPVRLWWLNRRGGFDSYSFTQRTRRTVGINRTEYNKLLGDYPGSGSGWGYQIGDRGRTTLSVKADETLAVQSNWLTEEEALWMEELFTSPEVYVSDINNVRCFVGTSDNSPTGLVLHFTEPHGFENGQVAYLDKDNKAVNPGYDGQFTITVIDDYTILTDIAYGTPQTGETGQVYLVGAWSLGGFTTYLDPVIVNNNGFEERTTKTVKNINYQISIDRAYGKTIQRN